MDRTPEPRLKGSIIAALRRRLPPALQGNQPLGRQPDDFVADPAAQPHRRTARPAQVLADLRGGCRNDIAIGVHAFGYGGYPITGGGWPSYYIEEMSGHSQCCQALLASMVLEGVFEHFPTLRLVLIEAGFAWMPSLAWRLDKHAQKFKSELPHLKLTPSEYIKRNVWITTQPMEEPNRRKHLADTIDWIGWDRLIFATDYPHWTSTIPN